MTDEAWFFYQAMRYIQLAYPVVPFVESLLDEVFRDDDNSVIKSIENVEAIKIRTSEEIDYPTAIEFIFNIFKEFIAKDKIELNCGRISRLALLSRIVNYEKMANKNEIELKANQYKIQYPDLDAQIDKIVNEYQTLINYWYEINKYLVNLYGQLCKGSYKTLNPDIGPTTKKPISKS